MTVAMVYLKKIIPLLHLSLIVIGISLAVVTFPPMYILAVSLGVILIGLIFLRVVKPIWIIVAVFTLAPFVDILRATYFKNIPFMGIYHELFLLLLLVSKIIISPGRTRFWRFGLLDYCIVLFIFWNLLQVIQSPSILGGLYVWRWYSIGPLTYLVFRFYELKKHEFTVIISAICIGLIAASIYIFYQYFILGPENATQITQSLGFTAFYRIGWRLPGPFSSPLVASVSYSILVILGTALLSQKHKQSNWAGVFLIVIGSLALVMTLSRSGIVIGLIGSIIVFVMNFQTIKYKLLIAIIGIIFLLQFSYLMPEIKHFLNYLTNSSLDAFDADRLAEFSHILTDSISKYPFGIGFSGGGAISQQAYSMFGGDNTYLPKYLGGDSVFFATLQTSGFLGLFMLTAIYAFLIRSSVGLLTGYLNESERIMCVVALGFFLGTFVTLGNLIDVWPIKLYLWTFSAIIMSLRASLLRITTVNIDGNIAIEEPMQSNIKRNL